MLENALRNRLRRRESFAGHAFGADAYHLARLDIADVCSVDQIESTGFGSKYLSHPPIRLHQLTQGQRPESVRIAGYNDAVLREKHERKRALELQQRIAQSAGKSLVERA